jgi:hypothetical protein
LAIGLERVVGVREPDAGEQRREREDVTSEHGVSPYVVVSGECGTRARS